MLLASVASSVVWLRQSRALLRGDFNSDSQVNIIDYYLFIRSLHTSNIIFALTGSDSFIDLFDYNEVLKELAASNPVLHKLLVYSVHSPSQEIYGTVTSLSGAETQPLQFRTFSGEYYKTFVARFATSGPTKLKVTLPEVPPFAYVISPTGVIPSTITDSTVSFELPKAPGIYVLKMNSKRPLETIAFWVDDYSKLQLEAPSGAIAIKPSDNLQSMINTAQAGATFYFGPGIYTYRTIAIHNKQALKFVFHPQAVLSQLETEGGGFIDLRDSSNITFSGPGEIVTPKNNEKTSFEIATSKNIFLNDFFLQKIHKEDGWTLHLYNSEDIQVNNVKIISGNDGTDPDSSSNVTYNGVYIESRDDALALKTRGFKEANNVRFTNGIAKTRKSALKIGEASVLRNINNVVFENSLVLDSDRALIVDPGGGIGKIGAVTFKNIMVRNMQNYDEGLTIRVRGNRDHYDQNTNIVFDDIDAEVIKTSVINHEALRSKVVVRNSAFITLGKFDVFPRAACGALNIFTTSETGPGNLGCN